MSAKRFRHTLGVERAIVALGEIYLPDSIPALRVAALLHDITKECTVAQQIALMLESGSSLTQTDLASPKLLHARTGAYVAQKDFGGYVSADVLDAIRKHTTGARDMSCFASLLYLADYIEDTRTFPDCVKLRQMFWDGIQASSPDCYLQHLHHILLVSYDMTLQLLLQEGDPISLETVDARNALLEKLNTHT